MPGDSEIEPRIQNLRQEINLLDDKKAQLSQKLRELEQLVMGSAPIPCKKNVGHPSVTGTSHYSEKIRLFQTLFNGRNDVYPRRFESKNNGRSGYQPACHNEWVPEICNKPKIKCANCENRNFLPVTDEVIRNHLLGYNPCDSSRRDFTIGVYPLRLDETCNFLTVDFDKKTWQKDSIAYFNTCLKNKIPAALERSRSGKGGHVWIFFSQPIPAAMARKMGAFILTEAMELHPGIGFDSYDRFFPNQDTLPKGGFGNLIALPLQGRPREMGNSLFIDENFRPYPDQWSYLDYMEKMPIDRVRDLVDGAIQKGKVIGVRRVFTDDNDKYPWTAPPSKRRSGTPVIGNMPKAIDLVFSNQIYIEKKGLPPQLLDRLIRLAAFQNPEFYKTQAMRLSTWNKPRIIACHEEFPTHIGLPRGCLEEIMELLSSLSVKINLIDKRVPGEPLLVKFRGNIRLQQKMAVEKLLIHDTGILSAAPAFGKTVIGIYLLAERKTNTLILVHRRQLMEQWIARIAMFLDLNTADIGQIGGGKWRPTGKIDVAMIQSLSKKGEVNDIVGHYGHLIVDECHHISARSFEIVARQCNARYVLGLSATITRKDGHHPIIFMNIGPIRYTISHRQQIASRPVSHQVVFKETNFNLPPNLAEKETIQIHEIYSALAGNQERNQGIVADAIQAVKNGRTPIILTERRQHLETLESLMAPITENVIALKGGMGKKQLKSVMSKLNGIAEDTGRIIIATGRYLGEGFDDSRLDTLFLTMPISWKGLLTQYAGRLHRHHYLKKDVIIYDYIDRGIPMLEKMHQRRLAGYKSIGYECK